MFAATHTQRETSYTNTHTRYSPTPQNILTHRTSKMKAKGMNARKKERKKERKIKLKCEFVKLKSKKMNKNKRKERTSTFWIVSIKSIGVCMTDAR